MTLAAENVACCHAERLSVALVNAADSGAVFVSRGSGAVVVQDCGGAAGGLLCRCSDDHHRAALFYMIGVKFLFADVIWLFAGKVAHFGLFERPPAPNKRAIQL